MTFGWQFRPVLGRHSVSPGLRQLFAVLALPVEDKGVEAKQLTVTARTYWRKYDARKSTTSGTSAAEPTALGTVDVMTTEAISQQLGPRIQDVQWRATDDKTAVVSIAGTNLFSGTQVVLGSKLYESPATGLIFKSDQLLELRTTLNELALGDAAVSGRYGKPVPLSPETIEGSGIFVNSISYVVDPGRDSVDVEVVLQSRDGKPLLVPGEQPLMVVGTEVASSVFGQEKPCDAVPVSPSADAGKETPFSRSATIVKSPESNPTGPVGCWKLTGTVPAAKFRGEPIVTVRYPFRGDRWQASFPIRDPFVVSGVTQLGTVTLKDGSKLAHLAITGSGFKKGAAWKVILDVRTENPNC